MVMPMIGGVSIVIHQIKQCTTVTSGVTFLEVQPEREGNLIGKLVAMLKKKMLKKRLFTIKIEGETRQLSIHTHRTSSS
jgi:hypothetical protein